MTIHTDVREFVSYVKNLERRMVAQGLIPDDRASERFSYGVLMVLLERHRRAEEEGFTPEHDDQFTSGSLAQAAMCYAAGPEDIGIVDDHWPWAMKYWEPTPENRLAELVKAGALITAEIDRRLREMNRTVDTESEPGSDGVVSGEK